VTSYIELQRDAQSCERWNRLHPLESPRVPFLQQAMAGQQGVFIAVSDYVRALAQTISPWMPATYSVLGTDGFGLSETRAALRDYFEVSADYIVHAALVALFQEKAISKQAMLTWVAQLHIDAEKVDPMSR